MNTQIRISCKNICHASYKRLKHAETQTEKKRQRERSQGNISLTEMYDIKSVCYI